MQFYAFGHICVDTEPFPHLGGGVTYFAVALERLGGFFVNIITKESSNYSYFEELNNLGVNVFRLPNRDPLKTDTIIRFANLYDELGNRRQLVSQKQENITSFDLANFPDISKASIILIAPILGEVDPELFSYLVGKGPIVVTPQGYFRYIGKDNNIRRHRWPEFNVLRMAKITILSDEDITFNGKMDKIHLEEICSVCPIVVLMKGRKGLTIFPKGEEPIDITVFQLEKAETLDLNGAGDVCAASFVWYYEKQNNLKEAGAFSALYSALKIKGIGGKEGGVNAIPTFEQIRRFVSGNNERVRDFYQENGLELASCFKDI